MRVTIAICTWNRAGLLDQTLRQMRTLEVPAGVRWQVLVVNNGCTDDTDNVLLRHAGALPLRRLAQSTPGKSNALNSAIAAIRSDLILWTDDDVLVDANWLKHYVAAASDFPQASFFGGNIQPWFEVPPPRWLTDNWSRLSAAYAIRDVGSRPSRIKEDCLPFGANFAVRTKVQKRYLYDPRLGRVGPSQLRGEETAVILQMLRDGHLGYWYPNAMVRHFIPGQRLTEDYLRHFYFGIGQTHVVSGERPRPSQPRFWQTAHAWSKAVFAEARFQITRRTAKPRRWIHDLEKSSYYWGCWAQFNAREDTRETTLPKAA